jgi:hypothetical protein
MTPRIFRSWLIFVLAFLMPLQAFASAIQCHSPVSAAASDPALQASHHGMADVSMHEQSHFDTAQQERASVEGFAQGTLAESSGVSGSGAHPDTQNTCANCAPCHASAQLVQSADLTLTNGKSALVAAAAMPLYLSVATPGLDRPPR